MDPAPKAVFLALIEAQWPAGYDFDKGFAEKIADIWPKGHYSSQLEDFFKGCLYIHKSLRSSRFLDDLLKSDLAQAKLPLTDQTFNTIWKFESTFLEFFKWRVGILGNVWNFSLESNSVLATRKELVDPFSTKPGITTLLSKNPKYREIFDTAVSHALLGETLIHVPEDLDKIAKDTLVVLPDWPISADNFEIFVLTRFRNVILDLFPWCTDSELSSYVRVIFGSPGGVQLGGTLFYSWVFARLGNLITLRAHPEFLRLKCIMHHEMRLGRTQMMFHPQPSFCHVIKRDIVAALSLDKRELEFIPGAPSKINISFEEGCIGVSWLFCNPIKPAETELEISPWESKLLDHIKTAAPKSVIELEIPMLSNVLESGHFHHEHETRLARIRKKSPFKFNWYIEPSIKGPGKIRVVM